MEDNPRYTEANANNPDGLMPYTRTGPPGLGFFQRRGPRLRRTHRPGNWPCFQTAMWDVSWRSTPPPATSPTAGSARRHRHAARRQAQDRRVELRRPPSPPPGRSRLHRLDQRQSLPRFLDSKTGAELWTYKLDYTATAVLITYQGKNGRQYVAIVIRNRRRLRAPPLKKGLLVFALR